MDEAEPRVIVLHGEDEFGISQHISGLVANSGEPALSSLNLIQLDGRRVSLEELSNAVATMPMFSAQKIVVVENVHTLMLDEIGKETVLRLLDHLPQETLVVLVEHQNLRHDQALIKWAKKKQGVEVTPFPLKRGKEMSNWILQRAKDLGGEISPDGAYNLAGLVGVDARMAEQELLKLLTYVDYKRTITSEDVAKLNSDESQVNIFYLVDALGNQDGKRAQGYLRTLLVDEDPRSIFGMILRQFRLILLTKEIVGERGGQGDVSSKLGVQDWIARKLIVQSRNFSMERIERIYARLMDMDASVKVGMYDDETGLEMFVAELTFQRGILFH